jgi:Skp family chaperone for outer membrane proteins
MQLARPAVRPARRVSALAVATVGAATAVLATAAAPARAQSGPKIGVVNVAVVSSKIQELKEFAARIQNEQQLLDASVKGHQAQLSMMQEKLNNLKPDSDAFDTQLADAQKTGLQFQMDDQLRKADLLREVNKQNKSLFLEVQQVVADIAKKKGLDLVIVEPEVRLPTSVQNVDPQQLNNLISQKTVLYASPNIDLTDEVATALDAQYKARGGGSAMPSK